MTHRTCLFLALAPVLLSVSVGAQAVRYRLTDLGPDTSGRKIDGAGDVSGRSGRHAAIYSAGAWRALEGNRQCVAQGVNAQGEAVGVQTSQDSIGVKWTPSGRYEKIVPDAVQSFGSAIHRDGTLYGAAVLATGHSFPFSKRKGILAPLPYDSDYAWTVPLAVNRLGQMAGFSGNAIYPGSCPAVPQLYANGAWTTLGSLGGACGTAFAMNDSGVVVGWSQTADAANYFHAFSWQDGVMTDLGTLAPSHYSQANDIDQQGRIVGGSGEHAFIYENGVMTALDTLVDGLPKNAHLDIAVSINEVGQILVNGHDRKQRQHAYVLDPR